MFANDKISPDSVKSAFLPWFEGERDFKADICRGGLGFNDASAGLDIQLWRGELELDGRVMFADEASNFTNKRHVLTVLNANELTVSFDNNMQPVASFIKDNAAKLYWYDGTISAFRVESLPNARSPMVRMDDVRDGQSTNRDLIWSYIRANYVWFRKSRDRFLVEYPLFPCHKWQFIYQCGMNVTNCYQWQMAWNQEKLRV